jgi:hypothetical protein
VVLRQNTHGSLGVNEYEMTYIVFRFYQININKNSNSPWSFVVIFSTHYPYNN